MSAPSDLMLAGTRLEAAVATLNGAAQRGDAGAMDDASENYQIAAAGFRATLRETTGGVGAELLERWLSL
jgi:hypothetical protein